MYDVLENVERFSYVLDHGYIELLDVMPRFSHSDRTIDTAIVEAARISTGGAIKSVEEDIKLIDYLWKNGHTSPFEMVELKWEMKMPIFIARQWVRHRTANINEYSGRYSKILNDYYLPKTEDVRTQSKINNQGSEEFIGADIAEAFIQDLDDHCVESYRLYEDYLKQGVSREMARVFLPVNFYTKWIWKNDLHNTLKFLALRMHPHAQKEIQQYAVKMFDIMKQILPITISSFEKYTLHKYQES